MGTFNPDGTWTSEVPGSSPIPATGGHYALTPERDCARCTHRATVYGLGPCDAHNGDVWPTRKDN